MEQPPVSISLINVDSLAAPLRRPDALAMLRVRAADQPVVVTPFLLMGAMSPVSVASALAHQIARRSPGSRSRS